jgi:hypothetical protein
MMSVVRSTLRYQSRLVARDALAVAVMHELAAQYPRYGYRRIQVFLGRHEPSQCNFRYPHQFINFGCRQRLEKLNVADCRADVRGHALPNKSRI